MNNQTVVTGKMVVMATMDELNAIQVPVNLLDSWGPHLSRAYSNLRLLYEAMENQEAKELAAKKAAAEHEPEIEVVEVGATDKIPEESPDLQIIEGGMEDAEENQLEGTIQE